MAESSDNHYGPAAESSSSGEVDVDHEVEIVEENGKASSNVNASPRYKDSIGDHSLSSAGSFFYFCQKGYF